MHLSTHLLKKHSFYRKISTSLLHSEYRYAIWLVMIFSPLPLQSFTEFFNPGTEAPQSDLTRMKWDKTWTDPWVGIEHQYKISVRVGATSLLIYVEVLSPPSKIRLYMILCYFSNALCHISLCTFVIKLTNKFSTKCGCVKYL